MDALELGVMSWIYPASNTALESSADNSRMNIKKRSVILHGKRTSVRMEDIFWEALKDIAVARAIPLQQLLEDIDNSSYGLNLSSALRCYALKFYRSDRRVG